MTKWYVTIDKYSSHIADPDECAWTISRDPGCTGWNTDSGHSGYGLTKADAEELANAANEIERLRAALRELIEAWDFWQSQETRSGFSELFANICEARAALEEKKDG